MSNTINEVFDRLIAARDRLKTDMSVTHDLAAARQFQDQSYGSPQYLAQIAKVRASLPNVVQDDTVGEFLYGCFQPELAVEIACTPACADSGLRNPSLTSCEMAAYKKKGDLKKINSVVSDEAHVFVAQNNQFTSDDRHVLREQGIKVVTLYNQDDANINYVLGETINIQQTTNPTDPGNPTDPAQNESTTNWAWFWIIIAVLFILLLIILLAIR